MIVFLTRVIFLSTLEFLANYTSFRSIRPIYHLMASSEPKCLILKGATSNFPPNFSFLKVLWMHVVHLAMVNHCLRLWATPLTPFLPRPVTLYPLCKPRPPFQRADVSEFRYLAALLPSRLNHSVSFLYRTFSSILRAFFGFVRLPPTVPPPVSKRRKIPPLGEFRVSSSRDLYAFHNGHRPPFPVPPPPIGFLRQRGGSRGHTHAHVHPSDRFEASFRCPLIPFFSPAPIPPTLQVKRFDLAAPLGVLFDERFGGRGTKGWETCAMHGVSRFNPSAPVHHKWRVEGCLLVGLVAFDKRIDLFISSPNII